MFKHIKVWLVVALLALSALGCDAAVAADADEESVRAQEQQVADIFDRPIDFENDLMMRWLAATFGTFVFEPFGVEGEQCLQAGYCLQEISALSYAIGFTNVLSFIIGSVIISYILVGGLINTAIEGVALGKQWSSAWLPIRIAGAFSCILPVPAGGSVFSLSQIFFFWLVVQGSNAANTLHELINEKITTGTPIVAVSRNAPLMPAKNALASLTCVKTTLARDPDISRYGVASISDGAVTAVATTQEITDVDGLVTLIQSQNAATIALGLNGECGTIKLDAVDDLSSTSPFARAQSAASLGARATFAEAVRELDSIAEMIVCPEGSSVCSEHLLGGGANVAAILSDGSPEQMKTLDEKMDGLARVYTEVLRAYSSGMYRRISEAFVSNGVAEATRESLNAGGWAARGMSFFQVSRMQQMTSSAMQETSGFVSGDAQPAACSGFSAFFSYFNDCEDVQGVMDADMKLAKQLMEKESIVAASSGYAATREPTEFEMTANPGKAIAGFGGQAMLSVVQERMGSSWGMTNSAHGSLEALTWYGLVGPTSTLLGENVQTGISTGSGTAIGGLGEMGNPFETTSAIGHGLHSAGATGLIIYSGLALAKGGADGSKSIPVIGIGGGVLAAAIEVAQQALMTLIVFCSSSGFVLAYLLPMMPILVWVMMLIGYLLMVVEGLIGAPMAVILLATPDGQGIINSRFERALSLVVSAVMKPSFMVIGFLACITVGYVGFAIFNTFFWAYAVEVLGRQGLSGMLLGVLAIMVIYTYGAYQLCTYLVRIMHMLPSQIMEWFSGGIAREFGENGIGQSIQSGFSSMGSGLQGINQAIPKSVNDSIAKRAAQGAGQGGSPVSSQGA